MKQLIAVVTIILLTACNGDVGTSTDTNTTTIEFSGDGMSNDLREAIEAGTLREIIVSEENKGGVIYAVTDVKCGGTWWRVEVADASNSSATWNPSNGNTETFHQNNDKGDSASLDCKKNGGQGLCTTLGNAKCTKQ